ncbi:hypothetical protein ASF24_11365 [Methylobacterium sp. Leaf86]|nr:hypothetical protein ASF24_11365 [Methylobacterium sp. Leaf86]
MDFDKFASEMIPVFMISLIGDTRKRDGDLSCLSRKCREYAFAANLRAEGSFRLPVRSEFVAAGDGLDHAHEGDPACCDARWIGG